MQKSVEPQLLKAFSFESSRKSGNRDSGMALFIVLVLVLVLTVVITQMVFVTQVEKRISKNRQGFVQLNYALQASSRLVLQKVSEDLMEGKAREVEIQHLGLNQ